MPKLKQLEKDAGDKLVIIGVHVKEGAEKLEEFVEKEGISHPMAADGNDATATRYRVEGTPTYVLVDKKGIVRSIGHSVPAASTVAAIAGE